MLHADDADFWIDYESVLIINDKNGEKSLTIYRLFMFSFFYAF